MSEREELLKIFCEAARPLNISCLEKFTTGLRADRVHAGTTINFDGESELWAGIQAVIEASKSEQPEIPEEVWVVSKGSYSDYRVLVACKSKEEAEDFSEIYDKFHHYSESFVESFQFVSSDIRPILSYYMNVEILDDGTEKDRHDREYGTFPFDTHYDPDDPGEVEWKWYRNSDDNGGSLSVSGKDQERVRKVFGDKRALIHSDDAFRERKFVCSGGDL